MNNPQPEPDGRKLRIGIVGYGFIAAYGHIPGYLERIKRNGDLQIVAIADIVPARREAAAGLLAGVRIYNSAEALLENEADNLDYVDICTPPYDHSRIATLALRKGLHVLCEKPLTIHYWEAEKLFKLARARKRVIFPCHNYKHAPIMLATREIIASGRIGKVTMVTINTFRNTHARGVPEWHSDWRREKKFSGGGIAMDHGSHSLYLIFDWMKDFPVKVSASMTNLQSDRYDTEDNFQAELVFPSGLAQINLTWTAGVRKNFYSIQGTKGAITIQEDDIEIAVQQSGAKNANNNNDNITWSFENRKISSHWMDASHVSWFNSLVDDFRAAIVNNQFVGPDSLDALACIKVINAAYKSAKTRRRKRSVQMVRTLH